ncbi:MAG TPA: hypothetical protein VG709_01540 [Actinomycetota bacterium]|nr:hypothetical protein [Actinomycetota bacterium]
MPEHTHQHGGLPPHDHDAPGLDHDHDDEVVDRDREVERDTRAETAVTVAPAPGGVAARILLTILGAAGMIIGAFLSWFAGQNVRGVDFEFRVFYSTDVGGEAGFVASAGFILIILGLIALLGLAFRVGWLTSFAGALGLLAMVAFTVTLYRGGEGELGLGDVGIGAWICAIGSLITLIAGWFGGRDRVVAAA